MEYASDADTRVSFPVWILGTPGPIREAKDLIDGLLTLESDGVTSVLVFTDQAIASEFLGRHGDPAKHGPREVRDPQQLDHLLTFYATKMGAKDVLIGKPGQAFAKASIVTFRFVNIAMQDQDPLA